MPVKCKTFEMYVRELIYHPERSKKWLADKRLSETEKSILRCHLLVRDNKSAEAISEVEATSKSDIPFVNDQKNLLLGICFNNTGKYKQAEMHLSLAREGFEKSHQYYHLFTTLYNLTMLLRNLGRTQDMASAVHKMAELRVDGVLPKIRLLRCQCSLALDLNDHVKFEAFAGELKNLKLVMSESELGPQLVTEFMFYIKTDKLEKAESILVEMKKYRKFTLSENFIFMKSLLSYLRTDATIYVYENLFPDPTSDLFYQMKVVEAFQLGDKAQALKYWNKLQSEYSQNLYQDHFNWTGEKCLFSLCLFKNKFSFSQSLPPILIKGDGPKHQVVFEYLAKAHLPVKAAELYEVLYDSPPVDKDELRKLVRLIVSVRDIYKVEIISKKGTYQKVRSEMIKKKA